MTITLEFVSNTLQLLVGVACAIYSGFYAVHHTSQRFFILTCFYITFALGSLYWSIYLLLNNYSPKIFYVSDLSWVASFFFLLILCITATSEEEKSHRSIAAWVVVVILIISTIIMMQWGDYLITILWHGSLTVSAYIATRGWSYAYKQSGLKKDKQIFYGGVLIFILVEFGLLLASCYFPEIRIDQPYIWLDFALTICLGGLLPATIWGLSNDLS